jgi:hypothetical protein
LNALFFVNPRSKAQVYFLAGFGWTGANVTDDISSFRDIKYTYSYFGAQVGIGLEYRFSRHFAMNGDLRGFVRGRIDDRANYDAEFVDPATGRTTNSSGGGLITLGATFYF